MPGHSTVPYPVACERTAGWASDRNRARVRLNYQRPKRISRVSHQTETIHPEWDSIFSTLLIEIDFLLMYLNSKKRKTERPRRSNSCPLEVSRHSRLTVFSTLHPSRLTVFWNARNIVFTGGCAFTLPYTMDVPVLYLVRYRKVPCYKRHHWTRDTRYRVSQFTIAQLRPSMMAPTHVAWCFNTKPTAGMSFFRSSVVVLSR